MRLRWWIGIVALFGVLLHAGAIVRHNSVMLGATLQYHALVADLAQICHGGGTAEKTPPSELPYIPKPTDAQNGCPICSGLSPVFALIEPEPPGMARPVSMALTIRFNELAVPSLSRTVHPPARGPPSSSQLA